MRAEEETVKAIELAENVWQLGIARRQLQEIRRLYRESARRVHWTKTVDGAGARPDGDVRRGVSSR
jgi:hypothetical protein